MKKLLFCAGLVNLRIMTNPNRYAQIIEAIFFKGFTKGKVQIPFAREEIVTTAKKLKIALPKNLGDILYSFRYRSNLPGKILDTAPSGFEWVIASIGRSQYQFHLRKQTNFKPNENLAQTKIPDATPGIIS